LSVAQFGGGVAQQSVAAWQSMIAHSFDVWTTLKTPRTQTPPRPTLTVDDDDDPLAVWDPGRHASPGAQSFVV
jgi:hypothetical protein